MVCFCSKVPALSGSRSRLARFAVLRLCVEKMSSFFGFERPEAGLLEVEVLEELIRELSWEVKDRVVDEEISLPPARFR